MKSRLLPLGLAALLAVGCGSGSEAPTEGAPVVASGPAKGAVEVQAFQGGYGIDFYETAAKEYEKAHPGVKVTVAGNPRVWEQLRPRLVGGTPPDLMFPGWGLDHWALAEEGELASLDAALDGPAEDGKGKWRDTFEPALLKLGQLDGKQYVLPYYFNVMGWWYDPGVFAKHGWTPPKTYDDLLALGPKIKAAGMAPLTYQGQYPYYMIEGMLMPWAYSVGGAKAVNDAQSLAPGAWNSPAMLKAASMIAELKTKGFFQTGATALSHTQAQQAFLEGKAAMIPCGTWLYSEMKGTMPKGASVRFMLPPVAKGGVGDPTALLIGIEPWMVPAQAKNKEGAIAVFRAMTALPMAKRFVEEKGTLTAIKGSDAGDLLPELKAPSEAFKASKAVWSDQFRQWYPALEKEVENALTALLNGSETPESFCARVEKAADATRKDDSIRKHTVQ
jgi:N-acetylglucosamine transport system substrate-binding protein